MPYAYLAFSIPDHRLAELHRLMNEEVRDVAVFFMDPRGIITVWNRAEVLRVLKLDEAQVQETSEVIARQAHHMTSLVDDLLDVSRVTRGLVTLERQTLDVREIVKDAVEQVNPVMHARQHRLALHLPPAGATALGDRKASGHQVTVEHDPHRALERSRAEPPDVCLLDIGLPEMDGKELARRIKAQPETARAVLIAVTGYGQEHDRESALAAGFAHHFVKPVDPAGLAGVLAEISQRSGASG
jgi:CheY-like chemotaxis protein